MHELSIVMSILEIGEAGAAQHGGGKVTAVHLRLGQLAGVVKDALLTSYEIARENSPLAGSQLIVEDVPGIVYCPACDAERRVQTCEWFICAECGGIASHIVQGKELEVVALEVEP